ncbi:MAG: F0F1 ATP synthase subunit alpha [Chloroflexi bacterium]|nr:F0F1 ATP synthase subunit alpha [Chloroflexota bacterium]
MPEKAIRDITTDLFNRIDQYEQKIDVEDIGIVKEVGDGIARVAGLNSIGSQELVEFENGALGIAFNLEIESIGIIVLGDYYTIKEDSIVKKLGRVASIPVGKKFLGRVINPLGEPIDGKGPVNSEGYRPIEKIAPGIIERSDVDTPLQTGIKAIDAMTPIGRGQRELIIGDRQTGKTAIAIDTIINQSHQKVYCIYVAIGQKKSSVAQIIAKLEEMDALENTIVIMAGADENAGMQYIAPYAGCAMSEYFMERGEDALVVYDDLSKHAWAYRQLSLLMRRPPGREAYPGDLFYLHSRLLERSAKLDRKYLLVKRDTPEGFVELNDSVDGRVFEGPMSRKEAEDALNKASENDTLEIRQLKGSGGSSTALPIIETLLGDVSAYVPTNVISITDGQIYLETGLFNAGIRPAINVGISVSRVGGSAQIPAMKKVAGSLRLDMAAFHEIASFAQFGSDLDKTTMQLLERGEVLQELLKQPQYTPYPVVDQVMVLYAGTHGYLDKINVADISRWEKEFLNYMHSSNESLCRMIGAQKKLTEELEAMLVDSIEKFNMIWK